ncbi:hypothetical protein QNI19_15775 [Cytophagaceae bacterium DM2B3-1]|uniref:Lipoprotein n=1 Tax=Xanthocytophaga flava TaxID=3048013 RepID=A0ABT7CKX0_9BACT|nr:hypothetical protein [Xanthocytophaga flavus]MDJ1494403.1 hypothetical protein [Xanthocytophaga flavus]
MQNVYKACFKVLLLVTLFISISCKKDEVEKEHKVHVLGIVYELSPSDPYVTSTRIAYWMNGVVDTISDLRFKVLPNSMYVSDDDVYVTGLGDINNVYWKNGSPVYLKSDIEDGYVHTSSVFVSDKDVYVAGYVRVLSQIPGDPLGSYRDIPMYWKNGIQYQLPTSTGNASTTSIYVSGSDVYVLGVELKRSNINESYTTTALYWKNGVVTKLSDEGSSTLATSLFVSGNDVYVAGYERKENEELFAKYWKNGIGVNITDEKSNANVRSIFVSGNDVYLAGSVNEGTRTKATYWKNGIPVYLDGGSPFSTASSIYVLDNEVYVAGIRSREQGTPNGTYWKNGVEVALPINDTRFIVVTK